MSDAPGAAVPTDIELESKGRRLRFVWADGQRSDYDWEYLRWRCPCASCSGEGSTPGMLDSLPMFQPGQTDMVDINLTGRYAVTPVWGDGHDLGIYSFRMLRALCPCETCTRARGGEPPRRGHDW